MGQRDRAGHHIGACSHDETITSTTAGIERVVCESCGHVSVRFKSETVKIFPDEGDLSVNRSRKSILPEGAPRAVRCIACEAPAVFMIPRGLACAEHAWAAAARQDALGAELWIPIRIDQHSKTR